MRPYKSQRSIIESAYVGAKDISIIMEFGNERNEREFSGSFIAEFKIRNHKKRVCVEDNSIVKVF